MSYYPSYRSSSNNIKVELDIDLSNYTTKDDVKKVQDKVDENERRLSFNRGFFFYLQKNYYVYECKSSSFDITAPANSINFRINTWKSTGIFSSSSNDMIAVKNASGKLPRLGLVDDYYVNLSGNHFQQNKTNVFNIYNNNTTNIYCVYKLDSISSSRDLLCKMLYLDQYKLLKMLILVSMNIKDMVFVLMKVVRLAKVILQMVEMF